jgi:hypothetical protein
LSSWRLIDLAQWIFEEFRITIAKHADSEAKRPVIPTEGGHPFRSKAATDSDRRRPPC